MILKTSILFFKSVIREKEYLFWNLVFPLILMITLITIFSSLYTPKSITFNLHLIKQEGIFSNIIEDIFKTLSSGENKIFNLKTIKDYSLKDKLISDLKAGKTHLIVEVPETFDTQMFLNLSLQGFNLLSSSPEIKIYSLKYSSSQTSALIVRNILQKMELEFIKKIRPVKEYKVESEIVGTKKAFSYVDFIYPGIVIYSIFLTCLFGIGLELSWYREGKILKRLYITPISSFNLFSSFFLSRFYLIFLQIVSISLVSKVIYKSTVNPFSFPFLIYTFLSIISLSAFGIFIASMSKDSNSANVLAQIIQFPLQFLGGIYFPVHDVSWVIRWIVLINPITYLAAGIRDSLGILASPYPSYLTILIPVFYTILFTFIALKRYRMVEF